MLMSITNIHPNSHRNIYTTILDLTNNVVCMIYISNWLDLAANKKIKTLGTRHGARLQF